MAYLIMAHNDRAGLERLLARLLADESADFAMVHADARSALWQDLQARPLSRSARIITIPHPAAVRWGHWSQVEADRLLIDAALAEGCDFAHVISGADWPAVPRAQIVEDIAQAGADNCFIEAVPGIQAERMQTWRLDSHWLQLDPRRNRAAYAAAWELRRLSRWGDGLRARLGAERSQPYGPWRKGSSWWSLPRPALEHVSRELAALKQSGRLSGTVCADEHAVQTIVTARCGGRLQPNRRFIDFEPGQSSPRLLGAADLPAIRTSGAWFFRKVSASHDPFFTAL
ncbi:MAG: glycosyl transferase [Proteobacteria bacterium]|nr:glycosyl transferase [Pseudomonadota bacterium]